ncbi:hypothetical protein [uncultured Sphaerochaeta sp.]|uniref:hypothetical protein n=1 Tax=uncultured Sphaerochaeta sp. TaxID=886478 RepID=UPI002A0A5D50|nr:hypothetical protein [uncultured Sphaerochaeta sp.]
MNGKQLDVPVSLMAQVDRKCSQIKLQKFNRRLRRVFEIFSLFLIIGPFSLVFLNFDAIGFLLPYSIYFSFALLILIPIFLGISKGDLTR